MAVALVVVEDELAALVHCDRLADTVADAHAPTGEEVAGAELGQDAGQAPLGVGSNDVAEVMQQGRGDDVAVEVVTAGGERGRGHREVRREATGVHVEADAGHQQRGGAGAARGLDQNARHLAFVEIDVVGPFDLRATGGDLVTARATATPTASDKGASASAGRSRRSTVDR